MEKYSKTTAYYQTKKEKDDVLKDILKEYCLKRNSFNPTSPSPNVFLGKLQLRMKKYYNNLYNSSKRFTA